MNRWSSLILITFVFVSVIAPLAMAHDMSHNGDCPIGNIAQLSCALVGSPTEHLSSLQSLFTATPIAIILLVVFMVAIALIDISPDLVLPRRRIDFIRFSTILSRAPLTRWHAQLVHSPTLSRA